MFLTEKGKLYSCGWSADGQTGLGHYNNQSSPSLLKGDISEEKITKVACSADCVLAINGKFSKQYFIHIKEVRSI